MSVVDAAKEGAHPRSRRPREGAPGDVPVAAMLADTNASLAFSEGRIPSKEEGRWEKQYASL